MNNSVHQINIEHSWSDKLLEVEALYGIAISVRTCKDCGAQTRILHSDNSLSSPTLKNLRERPHDYQEEVQIWSDRLSEYNKAVFANSDFSNLDDFAKHLDNSYENSVCHDDINSRLAIYFLGYKHATRKARRKLLLLWKQGPVCNRCDKIFSINGLTEDHIIPRALGGQSKLTNLQLLCEICNSRKANENPNWDDVSPFKYDGESCSHTITCYELNQLETYVRKEHAL